MAHSLRLGNQAHTIGIRSRNVTSVVPCLHGLAPSRMRLRAATIDTVKPPVEDQQAAIRQATNWFRVPPKVYFKGGCLEVALAELAGKRRALVVTDQQVYDLQLAEKVKVILDEHNIQNLVFTHVGREVTAHTVADGLREVKEFRPDVIIALGGGAPMDAAKIIWLLYEMPSMSLKGMIKDAQLGRASLGSAPHTAGTRSLCICVPTTSGTGAEVTPFAVVRDEETGRKVTLADYALTPSMAVVDPQLVLQLPKEQTAHGGQLTLAHAMESYVSIFATDYSRAMSKHAMSMMNRYYQRAYEQGTMDLHAREKMHNAATVAGMAFANTYLGACHALASEVSITSGCHLGLASGVLLPHVITWVAEHDQGTKEALAALSDHLHVGGTTLDERYRNVMTWMDNLRAAGEIPTTLRAALGAAACAKVASKQEAICAAALDNSHMLASPVQPTLKDLQGILTAAGM